jgi:hypothetical protein
MFPAMSAIIGFGHATTGAEGSESHDTTHPTLHRPWG